MASPSSLSDPALVLLSFAWIGAVIVVGELTRRLARWSPDVTRKVVHVGVGFWALPTALWFDSALWAAACPLAFVGLNFISYRLRLMPVVEQDGRGSPGTIYFPLAFAGLILILWPLGDRSAMVAGLYAMGFGDAAASVVGGKWGRHGFAIRGVRKSWEGSIAFAGVSFVAIFLGTQAVSLDSAGWIAPLGAALAGAVAEAPVGRGLDNLTVPVVSAIVFRGLERLGA